MTTVLLHEGSAAPKLEPSPRPQVRAVRGGNHGLNRVRHVMRTAVIVLILAVFGGLAISSLMSGATLMELNAQVDEVSVQLAEAQSEYDYLNTRMNDITSRASLQQVAEGELGLVNPIPQRMPKGIPMAEITPASYSTDRRSWPRVAPTERNSPNCRVRSETEMEKAL